MEDERIWVLWGKEQAGELDEEEAKELKDLIERLPDADRPAPLVQYLWQLSLKPYPDEQIGEEPWERISASIGEPVRHRVNPVRSINFRRVAARAAIAAILVVLAGVGFYQFYYRTFANDQSSHLLNQVITQPDSKSQVELPDGTTVWLNKQSRLTYNSESFGTKHREVTLVGEAFFDVRRNESVPFIISTNDIKITVKGTAFNVKAYPDSKVVETALVRGLIEITTKKDPDRKILLRPNEKFTLDRTEEAAVAVPRQQRDSAAFISYTVTRLKNPVGIEPSETAWMKQRLVFNGETMEELAPKLESWYNIRITFQDPKLKSKRFSGIVEKETLEQALKAMQLSSAFRYKINGDQLTLGL